MMYSTGVFCYARRMDDLLSAPGANLTLNVFLATKRIDVYEELFIRYQDGEFVPVFDQSEEEDGTADVVITEENFPILVKTIAELEQIREGAKIKGHDDLRTSAALCAPELFQARAYGYTGEEGKYWTDKAPALLPLFEAERRA